MRGKTIAIPSRKNPSQEYVIIENGLSGISGSDFSNLSDSDPRRLRPNPTCKAPEGGVWGGGAPPEHAPLYTAPQGGVWGGGAPPEHAPTYTAGVFWLFGALLGQLEGREKKWGNERDVEWKEVWKGRKTSERKPISN